MGLSLYAFEFFNNFSENYTITHNELKKAKKENNKALKKFKDAFIDTKEFNEYLIVNNRYKKAIEKHKKAAKEERFFNFKSFQLFSFNFFPIISLLGYFIFNLYRSFKKDSNEIGSKIIHFVFIMFASFKLLWIFNASEDLSKIEYYFAAFVSGIFIVLAVWIIYKQELNWSERVKKKLLNVSYHALANCDKEKIEEMTEVIKQPI